MDDYLNQLLTQPGSRQMSEQELLELYSQIQKQIELSTSSITSHLVKTYPLKFEIERLSKLYAPIKRLCASSEITNEAIVISVAGCTLSITTDQVTLTGTLEGINDLVRGVKFDQKQTEMDRFNDL